VKSRWSRIDLWEIEARLAEQPGVREAVVLARQDTAGEKRLVAYYTSDDRSSISVEQLREQLSARLPGYMMPAAFVRLESLPLTPKRKLNRRALPAPLADAFSQQSIASVAEQISIRLKKMPNRQLLEEEARRAVAGLSFEQVQSLLAQKRKSNER
jgi:non-ribosomal peptide synthetase component E (peptide arylation enzyme)